MLKNSTEKKKQTQTRKKKKKTKKMGKKGGSGGDPSAGTGEDREGEVQGRGEGKNIPKARPGSSRYLSRITSEKKKDIQKFGGGGGGGEGGTTSAKQSENKPYHRRRTARGERKEADVQDKNVPVNKEEEQKQRKPIR